MTGVLKPGTITLILGQPGSGKSSFMKALAGSFHTTKTNRIEGSITYNGKTKKELDRRLPQFVSYTEQRDHHYHTLTVQETLAYAHQFAGGVAPQHVLDALTNGSAEENAEAKKIIEALYAVYPEVIVQQLGLNNCKDTIVGNAMLRGVSGGERKRVTLGEMEFGMKQVSLMDEISTGLDAAATFDIVKTQRSAARQLKKTIVISLLQPGPEVFDLFDDVIIFNEGHVMYHGPPASVLSYFESLGFRRPPHRDVADFLLDLGTAQQDQYAVASAASVPRLPSDYAVLFRESSFYRDTLSYVNSPTHPKLISDAANHMAITPVFYNSFVANIVLLTKRQLTVTLRDRAFIISSIVMAILMALLYSSSFYQMNPQQPQVVMGVIFQSLLFFITSQVPKLPIIIENRKIFYKQRDANFFSTLSYVVAHALSHIPFAIVETLLFGNIMYWMAGFVNDGMAYVTFMFMLFLVSFVFSAWFFVLGCVSSDVNVAQPLSFLSVMIFVLFAGFIIVERDLPDYLVWLFWINPVAWIMRGLAVNQYSVPEFQVDVYEGVTYKTIYNHTMGDTIEVSTEAKLAFVEECLSLLELTSLVDTIVRGSSVEQMKRLTIGVELAAAPSVLFLDEPTSGLDARSAKLVISGIRKIASTGRTVECTIHQPSAEVFEMFDSLLLLKRGGQTVFFGDLGTKASHLISYFTRIPEAPLLLEGVNPATWMLECIGAGVEVKTQTANVDFVQVFQHSPEYKHRQDGLDKYASPSTDAPELKFTKKRAASPATQCRILMQRFMRM
ncbi:unnamed protein product [Aphanomyces euteiches]